MQKGRVRTFDIHEADDIARAAQADDVLLQPWFLTLMFFTWWILTYQSLRRLG